MNEIYIYGLETRPDLVFVPDEEADFIWGSDIGVLEITGFTPLVLGSGNMVKL